MKEEKKSRKRWEKEVNKRGKHEVKKKVEKKKGGKKV